jgi:hypothetical protein
VGATGVLLSQIHVCKEEDLPLDVFLTIGNTLHILYPPDPKLRHATLGFFGLLRNIINSVPSVCIVPVLTAMHEGLCRWIEDNSEILFDNEYNDIVGSELDLFLAYAQWPHQIDNATIL